jgi:hypothetical protein
MAIAKSLQSWYSKKKRYWIGGETLMIAQTRQADFPELSHIDYSTVNWEQIAEWLLTRSENRDRQ